MKEAVVLETSYFRLR